MIVRVKDDRGHVPIYEHSDLGFAREITPTEGTALDLVVATVLNAEAEGLPLIDYRSH